MARWDDSVLHYRLSLAVSLDRPARLVLCAGCRVQVVLCSHCDRGNRHCSRTCRRQTHDLARRDAACRYQRSRGGSVRHAARSQRWRRRTALRAAEAALPNQLEQRFAKQLSTLSSTEREATVRQRVGQDLFREGLMTLWRGRCAISGLEVPELLRASHAKPWAASTDAERLDVYNGLLLAAHLDAAFDAGLITVLADGTVDASPLPTHAKAVLQLDTRITVNLSPRHEAYLA